jgi:nitrate/TMAO reductase-like tetraheme cytochrome c subunit
LLFKKLPKKKRILLISLISFFVILILLALSAEFTSRPKFCTTCHYMQSFYDSWATSSHKDVKCVTCHYEPGLKSVIETKTVGLVHLVTYLTEFYKRSKPTAEVSDASCLRSGCHEKRLLSGKEKFKRVFFDHEPHLTEMRRGKRLRCTSCHSQMVMGDHMKVTESTCFLCHFKTGPGDRKIQNCGFCHDAPTRENTEGEIIYDHTNVIEKNIACERCHTEMVVGDGAVPLDNCYNCHMEQERLDRYSETSFMHQAHITDHKIECQQCHTAIQHKLPQKEELHLLDCSGCHIESHKAQIDMFKGTGGYDAHVVPNPMFVHSITCKGCHIFHSDNKDAKINGETLKANKESCESCHGKGFAKLLNQWKQVSQSKLNQIEKSYHLAADEISVTSSSAKNKAKKLLAEAKYNIDLVDIGKSVHNVQFADELLRAAHKNIKSALKTVSSETLLKPYQETSKVVPAECNTCHFGIEVQSKALYGLEFSHQNHVVGREQECKQCHSNDRRHGELIMTKAKCATCHHNEDTEKCSSCHTLQNAVYTGTVSVPNYNIEPDVMFESEVECISCHYYGSNESIIPQKENCMDCHEEEEYLSKFDSWREDTNNSLEFIDNWLSMNKKLNLTDEQKSQVEWVKEVLSILKTDDSKGAHNSKFYESILNECQSQLNKINPAN